MSNTDKVKLAKQTGFHQVNFKREMAAHDDRLQMQFTNDGNLIHNPSVNAKIEQPKIDFNKKVTCPFCFLESTYVYENSNVKRIAEVSGMIKHEYTGEIVHVKGRYFPEVVVTADEKFIVREGYRCHGPIVLDRKIWKNACKLTPVKQGFGYIGDYLVIPKPQIKAYIEPPKLLYKSHTGAKFKRQYDFTSDDWFILFGWYVAEGHPAKKEIVFSMCSDDVNDIYELTSILRKVGLTWLNREIPSEKEVQICVNTRVLGRYFKEWFGPRAREKHIPEFIMSAPDSKIKLFLDSYFKGDGCNQKTRLTQYGSKWYMNKGSPSCVSTSEILSRQIQYLLLRLGKISGWTVSHIKDRNINGRTLKDTTSYQLKLAIIDGKQRFIEDKNNFYVPVTKANIETYSGPVYDIETRNHLVNVPYITHNCLSWAGLGKFLISTKKGYNKGQGNCPECHQNMKLKTLFGLGKWTPEQYAQFITEYPSGAFWKRVEKAGWEAWKSRLAIMKWTQPFWNEYKRLNPKEEDEKATEEEEYLYESANQKWQEEEKN